MATGTAKRRFLVWGCVAIAAVAAAVIGSGACKRESAGEKAGREAREAFEKSKEVLKEGLDKTKDLTKEGLEKSQEAAKDFQKGWKEGGK